MSPLQAFHSWFDDLPPEHQQEIALAVLLAAPDISVRELLGESLDITRAFRDWMAITGELPAKRAGKALVVRAMVDTFVMHTKDSSQDVKLSVWAQGAREDGHPQLAEAIERAIVEEPFRSRQWRRSLSSWKELCARELSDDSLNAWAVNRLSGPGR